MGYNLCMDASKIIDNTIKYVKDVFQNDFSGHDYFHTMRVYRMALNLAKKEKADLFVISMAALLHDVDDYKLSPKTYPTKERARSFLQSQNVEPSVINRIIECIDTVSFKGKDSVIPSTIEGKCVQDADRLDALGAMGISRTFAYSGSHNRILYDPDIAPLYDMDVETYRNHTSTANNHFYEKLFLLKDMLNTDAAKEIAGHREAFMKDFLDEFYAEWDGIK
jgi:uncharacterized protein